MGKFFYWISILFQTVLPAPLRRRVFLELHRFIDQIDLEAPLAERVHQLEDLMHWIHSRNGRIESPRNARERTRTGRLNVLLDLLEQSPERKRKVARLLQSILKELSLSRLFVSTGLSRQRSFLRAVISRILRNVFFDSEDETDGAEILLRLFHTSKDGQWMGALSESTFGRLARLVSFDVDSMSLWSKVHDSVLDAILVLSSDVRMLGLSDDVRIRSGEVSPRDSSALKFSQWCEVFFQAAVSVSMDDELVRSHAANCRLASDEVRKKVELAFRHMEDFGVDADLVYRLERMLATLDRIDVLVDFVEARSLSADRTLGQHAQVRTFMAYLARCAHSDRTIASLIDSNVHLMSRKIVERTGATGEHYITRDFGQYVHMLKGAGGGGFITVGTVFLKFLLASLKLPLFFEFVSAAFNYAGSFLIMQAFGFKLATKQPSMTASALAAKLHEKSSRIRLDHEYSRSEISNFTDEVVQITRSQIVAIVGNIGAVIPGAFLLDQFFRLKFGHAVLDAETAAYAIHSLDPLGSLTIPFAALTGVLLWLASIGAGGLENWSVFHRIPQALGRNRKLRRLMGRKGAEWVGGVFGRQAGGIGGNVSLGVLLALMPGIGKVFGFPLDVRHVTLSAGALTLGICSLGFEAGATAGLWWAVLGVVVIGALNFGVSFALALRVAVRAREVEAVWVRKLLVAVLKRFFSNPFDFILPPKA